MQLVTDLSFKPILISITVCPPHFTTSNDLLPAISEIQDLSYFLLQWNFSSIFISSFFFSFFFFNTKRFSVELLCMAICIITMTFIELAACRLLTGFRSPSVFGSFAIFFNGFGTGLLEKPDYWLIQSTGEN